MRALTGLVVRRRWWVVIGWIVAIVSIQVLSSSLGGATYKDDFKLPGTESQTVSDLPDESQAVSAEQPDRNGLAARGLPVRSYRLDDTDRGVSAPDQRRAEAVAVQVGAHRTSGGLQIAA